MGVTMAELYEIKDDDGTVLEVLGADDEPLGDGGRPTGETPSDVDPTDAPWPRRASRRAPRGAPGFPTVT
jgi:hypothetical protein